MTELTLKQTQDVIHFKEQLTRISEKFRTADEKSKHGGRPTW